MLKKVLSLLTVASLMFFTSTVFAANNEIQDSMNKASNTVRNVVGGAENVVENVAGAIGTGVRDVGNAVSNGVEEMTNNHNNNDRVGYDATRTGTTRTTDGANNGNFLGMSSNTWTWFVLAIAAIAIVGLVWYYAMQNKNEYHSNNR